MTKTNNEKAWHNLNKFCSSDPQQFAIFDHSYQIHFLPKHGKVVIIIIIIIIMPFSIIRIKVFFRQEKIKNTFSTCNSIAAWQKLKTYYLHDRSLDTSSIDWALQISKNQLCEIAHNLFVWSPNSDLFESVFKGHYKPPISRLFRERNTSFMQLGFCN